MSNRGAKNKPQEGVVLLIDVGEAVGQLDSDGESFLEKSKKCASRIIQRKIFSGAKDEYCLVLIGSQDTKNALKYQNIYVKNQYFCSPNWDLVKEIGTLSVTHGENSESVKSDWLDGLIVAVNLLKDEAECKSYSKKKIVLMSNFANPIKSKEHVQNVIDVLKDEKINLVVIGPETEDGNSENQEKTNIQRKGEVIINRIVDETDGLICGFGEAMQQLGRYQKVTSNAAPWYCDLQIGSDVFIPIVGYKKYDQKKPFIWKKRSVDNSEITEEQVYFEGDQQLDKGDVINSYPFGQTLTPFSEEDKEAVSLATEKCFQVVGFTKKRNVPIHILLGDSAFYVAPRNGFDGSRMAVSALSKVLLNLEMVAIVRRVHRKNAAPKLGALVPTCDPTSRSHYFYWVQLPFAEDEKRLRMPSLKKEIPTQEQLDAVDNLIDSMDLSQLDEDDDPYKQPLNPAIEHRNDLVSFKVLNPSSKVPTEPSEKVQKLLSPLPELLENALEALENIQRLFPLEQVEKKKYRRAAADVFKRTENKEPSTDDAASTNTTDTFTSFVQSTITEVGTIDPEGNFLKLLEQGEPFGNLCEQMQTAIKKLILTSSSSVGAKKAISAQKLLREHCVSKNPAAYNMFIASLKDDLVQRGNTELWNTIVQERLGLITSEESQQSSVSADEAEVFYEMKKLESEEEVHYEMEAEDLLDDL